MRTRSTSEQNIRVFNSVVFNNRSATSRSLNREVIAEVIHIANDINGNNNKDNDGDAIHLIIESTLLEKFNITRAWHIIKFYAHTNYSSRYRRPFDLYCALM